MDVMRARSTVPSLSAQLPARASFRNGGRDLFTVEGATQIWIDANHAVLLTMALHELATNACKYGALSNDVGRVRLQWNILQDRPFLRLHWSEIGGPAIEKQPSRVGFGSFLIERVLKVEGAGAQRLRTFSMPGPSVTQR